MKAFLWQQVWWYRFCPENPTRDDFGPVGVWFLEKSGSMLFGRPICCFKLGKGQTENCYIRQSLEKWNRLDFLSLGRQGSLVVRALGQ
jgi:hypothetical protein